jgi:hypothetical protein
MSFQFFLYIFIACEAFELFYVQKGNTIGFYIANLLFLYKRGILYFLCLHPSFYAAIFMAIYVDAYGILAIVLIGLKALDIIMKLILLQRIENRKSLGVFVYMIEHDANIPFFMKASISLFYISLFYMAFNS